MKKILQTFGLYLLITLTVWLLFPLLFSNVLCTIFNAIVGAERGVAVTNQFMQICFPIISAAIMFALKFRNSERKRLYLKDMEGAEYERRADLGSVLREKSFRIECISFTVIFLVLSVTGDPSVILYILLSSLFFVSNLLLTGAVHKKWCEHRMRK